METKLDYVKRNADEIESNLLNNSAFYYALSTCEANPWDWQLHYAMRDITQEMRNRGYDVSVKVNCGVYDWVFTTKIN